MNRTTALVIAFLFAGLASSCASVRTAGNQTQEQRDAEVSRMLAENEYQQAERREEAAEQRQRGLEKTRTRNCRADSSGKQVCTEN